MRCELPTWFLELPPAGASMAWRRTAPPDEFQLHHYRVCSSSAATGRVPAPPPQVCFQLLHHRDVASSAAAGAISGSAPPPGRSSSGPTLPPVGQLILDLAR